MPEDFEYEMNMQHMNKNTEISPPKGKIEKTIILMLQQPPIFKFKLIKEVAFCVESSNLVPTDC